MYNCILYTSYLLEKNSEGATWVCLFRAFRFQFLVFRNYQFPIKINYEVTRQCKNILRMMCVSNFIEISQTVLELFPIASVTRERYNCGTVSWKWKVLKMGPIWTRTRTPPHTSTIHHHRVGSFRVWVLVPSLQTDRYPFFQTSTSK